MSPGGPESRIDAAALCRTLEAKPDPLELYAALCDRGERPDTMFFEQADGPTFILDKAAVRAECRGNEVSLIALSQNGKALVQLVADRLRSHVVSGSPADGDELILRFPPVAGCGAAERLDAISPFNLLREVTTGLIQDDNEPFGVLALGVIAYDHVDFFETLPAPAHDPLGFPDYIFWIAESLLVLEAGKPARAIATAFSPRHEGKPSQTYFDAGRRLSALVERCSKCRELPSLSDQTIARIDPAVDLDDEAYGKLVQAMKEHVAAGDVYQIVASRSFSAPCPAPLASFARLRTIERPPYGYFVSAGSHLIFGASPETALRIEAGDDRRVEVRPIAGTRRRGRTEDEDNRLEAELRLDLKEQAEHMMLVDLARNDVARVSQPGSRHVARLMQVERHSKVMHLVSSVRGTLKEGHDFTHAMKACLNMGTLTGAPKIRAMQLLREAEPAKRGPYGGTIGWISGSGAMDSAIVIRSAVVMNGVAHVRAGAGIVHDSDPGCEADETRRKASALLSVLGEVCP